MAAGRARVAGSQRTRGAYHHGALREALLQAAESVLLERGVEGFTLRECARRAGVSHGAPAHHFGDVRGLLTALTAESFAQLEALMLEYRARAPEDAYAQFAATGLAYLDYALAHRARFQLMFRSDRLTFGDSVLAEVSSRVYRQLESTLRGAAQDAPETSLQPKIALAWSMVHGIATLMLDNRLFAENAGGDAEHAHALTQTLLLMCRDVFTR